MIRESCRDAGAFAWLRAGEWMGGEWKEALEEFFRNYGVETTLRRGGAERLEEF